MFASLTFSGSDQLARVIADLPQRVQAATLIEALTDAAGPMQARMAQGAPHGPDAPHLAEHIVVSKLRSVNGVRLREHEAAVGVGPSKDFYYGRFWEFGWRYHQSPHPFVRPAFEAEKAGFLQRIGSYLWRIIGGRSTTSSTL